MIVVYNITDQEDLENHKCLSDLNEIYEQSKNLLGDVANKRPQVVLIPLTAAKNKFVNRTKTNLNKYIRILSDIECKSPPAVHR